MDPILLDVMGENEIKTIACVFKLVSQIHYSEDTFNKNVLSGLKHNPQAVVMQEEGLW